MINNTDIFVLGLHVTGVQSSAALFRNGQLVTAVAEERLNRQKKSRNFPIFAIKSCLKDAGLENLDSVQRIVVSWNPGVHMASLNLSGFTGWRRYDPEWLYIVPNNLMPLLPSADLEQMNMGFGKNNNKKIVYLNHHNAHSGWAYASPFEQAAIAVIDEYGEQTSVTLGCIKGNKIDVLKKLDFPHSLGVFYATFTSYLGFTPNSDEWKVMGGAAYGNPEVYAQKLRDIVKLEEGAFTLDQNFFEFSNMRKGGYFSARLEKYLGFKARLDSSEIEQHHYDLAAACQQVFTELLFHLLNWLQTKTGLTNLVLNGGAAMNSMSNGMIIKNTSFEKLFVSSAPADNGASIGAALYEIGGSETNTYRTKIPAYTSSNFSDEEIKQTLSALKIKHFKPNDIYGYTVDKLTSKKIVGWFQGRMEFGERALGNRSIIADPRSADMKDLINSSVKYREEFRPFAPSVLAEEAEIYFELASGQLVDYMECVVPVRETKKKMIPAVVHEDGSARVHTVTKESNVKFYNLIKNFKSETGIPMLLNTSFNVNGEPVVCSPTDALQTYFSSGMDILVLGSYVIEK